MNIKHLLFMSLSAADMDASRFLDPICYISKLNDL